MSSAHLAITWCPNLSCCCNASLYPISCPKPLEQSCSRMGRITEVAYLYLYLILPHSTKISILSYLGDKRGDYLHLLSKINFQIIFPTPEKERRHFLTLNLFVFVPSWVKTECEKTSRQVGISLQNKVAAL